MRVKKDLRMPSKDSKKSWLDIYHAIKPDPDFMEERDDFPFSECIPNSETILEKVTLDQLPGQFKKERKKLAKENRKCSWIK